jgi:hypothetical protein
MAVRLVTEHRAYYLGMYEAIRTVVGRLEADVGVNDLQETAGCRSAHPSMRELGGNLDQVGAPVAQIAGVLTSGSAVVKLTSGLATRTLLGRAPEHPGSEEETPAAGASMHVGRRAEMPSSFDDVRPRRRARARVGPTAPCGPRRHGADRRSLFRANAITSYLIDIWARYVQREALVLGCVSTGVTGGARAVKDRPRGCTTQSGEEGRRAARTSHPDTTNHPTFSSGGDT